MKKITEKYLTLIFNNYPTNANLSGDTSYYSQLIKHLPDTCSILIIDLKLRKVYEYKDKKLVVFKNKFKNKKCISRLNLILRFLLKIGNIRSLISFKYYVLMFLTAFKFPELFNNN